MRALLFFVCLFSVNIYAQAPQAALVSLSPAMEVRIKKLETELRCLVCQNQTLADSPAGLANDLRRELRNLMAAGKTDDEIKDFLQTRYGDFVLYNPPIKPSNFLLWFGPFLLLGIGAVAYVAMLKKRNGQLQSTAVNGATLNDEKPTHKNRIAEKLLRGE